MARHVNLANWLSSANLDRARKMLRDPFIPLSKHSESKKRPAGVLIPFCTYQGKPSVIVVQRPLWMRKHAGEISFPGGALEPKDVSLGDAAIRECNEELGIKVTKRDIIGSLPFSAPNKDGTFTVSAVLASIGAVDKKNNLDPFDMGERKHLLDPHRGEVDDVYLVSLASLLENQAYSSFRGGGGSIYKLPSFIVGSGLDSIKIWGLTAMFLDHALKIINPASR